MRGRTVLPAGRAGVAGPDPATARALLARALVPSEGPWRVGWWEGCDAGVIYAGESVARAEYDGPDALADDLRVVAAKAHDKGEGAGLCGAHFRGARRTLAELEFWGAVQIDCEPEKGRPGVNTPFGLGWGILGDALPVDMVGHPSPSGVHVDPDGGDALRWRGWLRIAPVAGDGRGVDPWARAGADALRWCLAHLGVAWVDPSPLSPERVGWVHPRGGRGLAPEAVRARATGQCIDLAVLGAVAVEAGVVPRPRGVARGADRWDGAALLALATAAGCGPTAGASGRHTTRCPRGDEHSDGNPGGAALSVSGGWWVCLHSHAATHGRRHVDRHPDTAELVSWALSLVPADVGARLAAGLSPGEGPARRALARVADAPPRTPPVPRDAAGDALVSRAVVAVGAGARAVLVRATTGAGKSRAVPELVRRLAPPPSHDTRDAPQGARPAAVAVVLTPTQKGRDELSRALVSSRVDTRRRLVVIQRGVTEVRTADGMGFECTMHERATALQAAGVSVHATLCRDVGGRGRNACPRSGDCPAERGEVDAETGAAPAPADPRGRVVVATHAAGGGAALADAPMIVDEATAAPYETATLDPESLRRARAFAVWVAPRPSGVAAGVLVQAMLTDPGALARHASPGARRAWWEGVADGLAARVDGGTATRGEREAVAALRREGASDDNTTDDAPAPTTRCIVRAAVEAWVASSGRWVLGSTRPGPRGQWVRWRESPGCPGEDGGGRALAAFRAWCAGAPAVPQHEPGEDGAEGVAGALAAAVPHAWVVAVPSAATEAMRRHRGPIIGLDATGSEGLWRWATPRGPHELVRVDVADGGRVDRVVSAHGRATVRAMLAPGDKGRGGVYAAPRWGAIAPALGALVQTVVAWVAEHPGEAPGVALVSRPAVSLALALALTLHRAGRAPHELSHAELAALCPDALALCGDDDPDALAALHRNVSALVSEPSCAAAVASLAAVVGTLSPAWWGGVDARGSNDLMRARVYVALGDATVPPAVARLRAACEGIEPRAAADTIAAESARQWWGRARTVGRADPVLMVHSGTHHGWGPDDGARVVGLDGHELVPRATAARDARPIIARPVGPGEGPALVHALRAAGWTLRAIGSAAGVSTRAVQGWARGDSHPSPEAHATLAALGADALAQGALAGVAARVRAVLAHRRPGDVWSGGRAPSSGLGAMLRRAGVGGVEDGPAALRALRDGIDTPEARALAVALAAPGPGPWRDGAPPTLLDALERVRPPGAPRVAHELVPRATEPAPEVSAVAANDGLSGPYTPNPFATAPGAPGPARARPPRPPWRVVRAGPATATNAPPGAAPEAARLSAPGGLVPGSGEYAGRIPA